MIRHASRAPRTGIKVVVLARPTLFLETLTQALAVRGHLVQAMTCDAMQAVELIDRLGPDVCILEAVDPPSWLVSARRLREHAPDVKLVVLSSGATASLDRAYDDRVIDAVVARGCVFEQLDAALMRTVRGGRCVVRPRDAEALTANLADALTVRERQVLERLVRGATTDSIAQELGISPHTVRAHVSSLLRKLGVHARGRAVSVAVARHLLEARPA